MNDAFFLHSLSKIPGVGAEKLRKLSTVFDSWEAAWHASPIELQKVGISEKLAETIVRARPSINPEREASLLEREGVRLVARDSSDYPELLGEISNPPHLLYLRGSFRPNTMPLLTIVGTRRPTEYGLGVAREFARELARSGIGVVSGLALGIDQEAHRGALDGNGATIAVLGSGVDDASVTPRAHLRLAQAIALRGAILSDYPPGTPASEGTFPARNRIMAGLSLGTIVIEATEKSGTLITARLALEMNREVFAVPGSIYSEYSRGPHALLKEGAALAGSLADILDALPLSRERKQSGEIPKEDTVDLSPDETRLLKTLGCDTLHIDALVKRSEMDAPTVFSTVSFLEMKGLVKNIGNMHYIRTYTMNSK